MKKLVFLSVFIAFAFPVAITAEEVDNSPLLAKWGRQIAQEGCAPKEEPKKCEPPKPEPRDECDRCPPKKPSCDKCPPKKPKCQPKKKCNQCRPKKPKCEPKKEPPPKPKCDN